MTERTVVCWNGTAAADAALIWAVERNSIRGAVLTVIDVIDSGAYLGNDEALDPAFETQGQELLEARIRQSRAAEPQLEVQSSVLTGDPLDVLFAETSPSTLVVVGTERRTGPRVRFGWSFGARLAAAANGPVAIVPETAPDEPRRVGIVVGIDGTRVGDHALDFAAREATRRGEPLTIVHAWLEPLAWHPTAIPDEDFMESTERTRRELLDDRVRTVGTRHAGLTIESVLVHGEPVVALREAARTATTLVVGSRRLGHWKRAWLGSVSHGVILELVSPVIVVCPEGEHHDTPAKERINIVLEQDVPIRLSWHGTPFYVDETPIALGRTQPTPDGAHPHPAIVTGWRLRCSSAAGEAHTFEVKSSGGAQWNLASVQG